MFLLNVICNKDNYHKLLEAKEDDLANVAFKEEMRFNFNNPALFGSPEYSRDGCMEQIYYHGAEGCSRYNIEHIAKPIELTLGALLLTIGIVMTFAGGYALKRVLLLIIFMASSCVFLVMFVNFSFFVETMIRGEVGWLFLVLFLSFGLGGLLTFLVQWYVKAHFIAMLGGILGLMITASCLSPFELSGFL